MSDFHWFICMSCGFRWFKLNSIFGTSQEDCPFCGSTRIRRLNGGV